MKRARCALALLLGLAALPSCGTAPPAPSASPLDPEEAMALAHELEAAGARLSRDERRQLGLPAEEDESGPPPDARGTRLQAATRLRAGETGSPSLTTRVAGAGGPAAFTCRWRREADGSSASVLGARVEGGGLSLQAGWGGYEHGFGLLLAAPDRRRSVGASAPLAPGRQGWGGASDASAAGWRWTATCASGCASGGRAG